jgi:hypothetical protein
MNSNTVAKAFVIFVSHVDGRADVATLEQLGLQSQCQSAFALRIAVSVASLRFVYYTIIPIAIGQGLRKGQALVRHLADEF